MGFIDLLQSRPVAGILVLFGRCSTGNPPWFQLGFHLPGKLCIFLLCICHVTSHVEQAKQEEGMLVGSYKWSQQRATGSKTFRDTLRYLLVGYCGIEVMEHTCTASQLQEILMGLGSSCHSKYLSSWLKSQLSVVLIYCDASNLIGHLTHPHCFATLRDFSLKKSSVLEKHLGITWAAHDTCCHLLNRE